MARFSRPLTGQEFGRLRADARNSNRADPLKVDGLTFAPGQMVLFGDEVVTLLGPSEAVGYWNVAYHVPAESESVGEHLVRATAHGSQLSIVPDDILIP